MPKRLAITIAGAVSLGSYEAGVLFEVLDAIHQHNCMPGRVEADKIKVDVLTGASAGGMTAAIVAHKMLLAADEFRGPYDNPLYDVWVKRIGLEGLLDTEDLETGKIEPPLRSIFSSDLVERIARETLTARYDAETLLPPVTHEAAARAISLGMAMTNLNGVDYGHEMYPSGRFLYTQHEDEMKRHLTVEGSDTREVWREIREAAVASGAFPLAFRAKEMDRREAEYKAEGLVPWEDDPARYTYTDGGVLQNEPLGMAKNLVDEIDLHLNNESRFYLFVSPHGRVTTTDMKFREAGADYFHMLKRLAKVILGQSEFQDWVTAEQMNEQIALLDSRAEGLAKCLLKDGIDTDALQRTADDLLQVLFHQPERVGPRKVASVGPETIGEAQARIGHQYRAEVGSLGGEATAKGRAFRDAILAFEKAAGLGNRDTMRIYGMTVEEGNLAGAELSGFLGFFEQRFRDHDYDRGRMVARGVLRDPMLSQPGELGPVEYHPVETHPIDTSLNGIQLGALSSEEQTVFRVGIKRRVNEMVRELIGMWSYPADVVVIDPIVNAVLNQLFRD